ncbi:MAG TPA: hypothetical protein GXZ22_01460 [Clostridiaceae bacterium]|jgi:uncharacterized membrane protein YgaE (UPF0421/DUF939 family)|nr:hypothetical protein [Clostridiaceae bacterium]
MSNKEKKKFRIGLRSIKTVIAVFICCIIGYLRGVIPVQSTIAAILCIKADKKETMETAVTRIVGTLLGGATGVLALIFFLKVGIPYYSLLFYLILCILLIPVIYIPVKLGWPDATALTCVVYLVVVMGYTGEITPVQMAVERTVDTLLGVIVAVPLNMILPHRIKSDTDTTVE